MKCNIKKTAVLLLAAVPMLLAACGAQEAVQNSATDTQTKTSEAAPQQDNVLGHHEHDMHLNKEGFDNYNKAIDYVESILDTSVYSKVSDPNDDYADVLYSFETSAEKEYTAIDFPDVSLDGKANINIGTPVAALLDAGFEESGSIRAIRPHKGLNIYISDNKSHKQEVFVWNDSDRESVAKNCALNDFTFNEEEREKMIPFDCNGITVDADFKQVIQSLGTPTELRVTIASGNLRCLYQSKQNKNWEITVNLAFDSSANTAKLSRLSYTDTMN